MTTEQTQSKDVNRLEKLNEDKLVSLIEAAKLTNCDTRTLQPYLYNGELPYIQIGKRKKIRLSDIYLFWEMQKKKTAVNTDKIGAEDKFGSLSFTQMEKDRRS